MGRQVILIMVYHHLLFLYEINRTLFSPSTLQRSINLRLNIVQLIYSQHRSNMQD